MPKEVYSCSLISAEAVLDFCSQCSYLLTLLTSQQIWKDIAIVRNIKDRVFAKDTPVILFILLCIADFIFDILL